MHQILLNINFCDDVRQCNAERDGRKIQIVTGYSLSGIRLVPQELFGVGVIYISGGARAVQLHELKMAQTIEKGCAFAIVQPDMGFNSNAVDNDLIKKMLQLLSRYRELAKPLADPAGIDVECMANDVVLAMADRISDMINADPYIWEHDKKVSPRIYSLEKMILESHGHISLPELADSAGCTVRHVHRIFADEIGKGPKEFCRIVRIRDTVSRMLRNPHGNISNYMEGMGYSDQAHFQREFRWYTGYTPGNFIKIIGLDEEKRYSGKN